MDNQLTERRRDFSLEEVESLENYKKNGLPGITKMNESDAFQWFELYMSGKTYSEIAKITKSKRDLILYVSEKSDWHNKRMQYYSELSSNMLQKCNESKLETLNTVTTMVSALNKYFGDKFNDFLKTKDEKIIKDIDSRLLAQYYKATETVEKLIEASVTDDLDGKSKGKGIPIVNINMNGGTIKQTDENTIELTPDETEKEKTVGEILKSLSKVKKIRSSDE